MLSLTAYGMPSSGRCSKAPGPSVRSSASHSSARASSSSPGTVEIHAAAELPACAAIVRCIRRRTVRVPSRSACFNSDRVLGSIAIGMRPASVHAFLYARSKHVPCHHVPCHGAVPRVDASADELLDEALGVGVEGDEHRAHLDA